MPRGWDELEGLRVEYFEYFEFFQWWGGALYHRVGMEQEPGPRITNLQLLQLLFKSLIKRSNNAVYYIMARVAGTKQSVKLRAPRLQNKGGQQGADGQFGLVSAERQSRYLRTLKWVTL